MTYPQQPYGQHHYYPPGPPLPPAARNGLGSAGMVLGIVGLVFAFIPLVGVVAWPMVIVGLVLGILGLLRANRGEATNRGAAITGIACSAVGLIVCVAWVTVLAAAPTPNSTSAPALPSTTGATAIASAAPAAPSPQTSFDDGTYEVGVAVAPGKYRAPGDGGSFGCYWERAKNDSGEVGSIIANSVSPGPQQVTLKQGEIFKSERCGTWTKQ